MTPSCHLDHPALFTAFWCFKQQPGIFFEGGKVDRKACSMYRPWTYSSALQDYCGRLSICLHLHGCGMLDYVNVYAAPCQTTISECPSFSQLTAWLIPEKKNKIWILLTLKTTLVSTMLIPLGPLSLLETQSNKTQHWSLIWPDLDAQGRSQDFANGGAQ